MVHRHPQGLSLQPVPLFPPAWRHFQSWYPAAVPETQPERKAQQKKTLSGTPLPNLPTGVRWMPQGRPVQNPAGWTYHRRSTKRAAEQLQSPLSKQAPAFWCLHSFFLRIVGCLFSCTCAASLYDMLFPIHSNHSSLYSGFVFRQEAMRRSGNLTTRTMYHVDVAFSTHAPQGWKHDKRERKQAFVLQMAPQVGLEPTTLRLTAACSTN